MNNQYAVLISSETVSYTHLELDKLGVNPNEYSLNGNIESDKIVLYQNYSKGEVFYFDERGGRDVYKRQISRRS